MPPMPPDPNKKQQGPGGRHAALVNVEKPKNGRETLGKLLRYIGRSRYLFFGLMGVMLIITLLGLAAPYIQQIAIDCMTLDDSKLSIESDKLIKTLAALGGVYLANSVFSYMQGIFSAKLSQRTVSTMRRDLFGDLVKLPIRYFDTHRHGDIMSRMTNDVENISNTISQSIGSLISGVLTVIGSIVIMLTYSPLLTLISLSTVVLTILVSSKMTKFMRKYFLQQQIILGKLNSHVEEMVTGYRTVVSYSKEGRAV
ncbi:MAG: ABC transporter ATP-binding protein, partial [Ruminococcus sp.]|nr:ABC transporter ATP-binding protein [Ruminococcus sp.]